MLPPIPEYGPRSLPNHHEVGRTGFSEEALDPARMTYGRTLTRPNGYGNPVPLASQKPLWVFGATLTA